MNIGAHIELPMLQYDILPKHTQLFLQTLPITLGGEAWVVGGCRVRSSSKGNERWVRSDSCRELNLLTYETILHQQ
jgi:hypothetical protein